MSAMTDPAEPSPAPDSDAFNPYPERIANLREQVATVKRADDLIFKFRAAVFVLGLFALGALLHTGDTMPWAWLLGLAALGFAGLVFHNLGIKSRHARLLELLRVNERGLARVRRDWDALERGYVPPHAAAHPVTSDLDLVGTSEQSASLLKLIGATRSNPGRDRLFGWLLDDPDPAAELRERQAMVRELAPRLDFRQDLEAICADLGDHDPGGFFEWAREPSPPANLHVGAGKVWAARLLPLVMIGITVVAALGYLSLPIWVIAYLLFGGIAVGLTRKLHEGFQRLSRQSRVFSAYADAFDRLVEEPFDSPALAEPVAACRAAGDRVSKLETLVSLSDFRLQGLLYLPVLPFTFWDVHVAERLQTWHRENAAHVDGWFEAYHQIDALSGLAGLHHDHPAWAFADVAAGEGSQGDSPSLAFRALGHPLLADGVRVCNDLMLGRSGVDGRPEPCLLVTGSNMSGKSTLLRSIGINVLLGQAGGPVCASAASYPPSRLATSIRVVDSLEDGISFFMAQLLRLKEVTESARELARRRESGGDATGSGPPPRALFLLDEILSGTNTAERQVAVRRVLAHLVELGAFGAMSTHDLDLAKHPELGQHCRPVHFREDFKRTEEGPTMVFDYQLRDGISPTVNALKFLEIMGLGEDDIRDWQS